MRKNHSNGTYISYINTIKYFILISKYRSIAHCSNRTAFFLYTTFKLIARLMPIANNTYI